MNLLLGIYYWHLLLVHSEVRESILMSSKIRFRLTIICIIHISSYIRYFVVQILLCYFHRTNYLQIAYMNFILVSVMKMKFYIELFGNISKCIFIFCCQNELCNKRQLNETSDRYASIEHTWIVWLKHLLTINVVRCTILDFHLSVRIERPRSTVTIPNL